jgi:hypothetical protein
VFNGTVIIKSLGRHLNVGNPSFEEMNFGFD